jgi:hypothetical protein
VTGEIDGYLDEMFNRLNGTGGAGRRALAETEDHLRTAAAEGTAAGLSPEQAEREAVTRFGPAARIAGQLRNAQRRPWLTALSSAWVLAGIALIALGISYLAAAVLRWFLPPPALPACGHAPQLTSGVSECTTTATPSASIVHETAFAGVLILFVAAIVLLARRWAIRSSFVPPAYVRVASLAANLFFLASLYLFLRPETPFVIEQGTGARVSEVDALIFLLGSVVIGAWGIVRRGRPAHRGQPTRSA